MKYNKITLSFSNKEESLFREEYFQGAILQFRIAFLLLIFLYGVFGYLDTLIIPQYERVFHIIRFIVVIPILSFVLAISFTHLFKKIWQTLIFISLVVGGFGISIMTMLAPENYAYYAGMMLIFSAGYFFIKLRFFMATIAGWLILLSYNMGAVLYAQTPSILLIANNFFFISANLIGMFAAYNTELYLRRNFFLSKKLESEKLLVLKNNENLETIVSIRTKELLNAKEKAEESDLLKTAFLQNMSHEIRTPLNAIIGLSERITLPKITDDKRMFYADIIVKSGFQLLSIVNDILTISSIDTGQEELNKENVCINSLISVVETVFKQQLEGKMVKLKVIIPLPNAEAEVLTDKTKLTQILTNLLSNAIKFTPVGEIEYGYTLKNAELEFFVKDNGIGIDKSQHEIIFERFVQANDSIVVDYGGTGLGLSICKGFAELLGGKIWVESELGKGAKFFFTIPYNSSIIESRDERLINNQEEINQNQNKTVLVAEDHINSYIFIEEHLKELNYKVIHAKNGKEAVEICRTNESIDIVLMDIRMPVMDGHKATMLIKDFRPNLKIIAQTAYAINIEIEKFGKAFDDYLTKPITSEKITNILNKHLKPDK